MSAEERRDLEETAKAFGWTGIIYVATAPDGSNLQTTATIQVKIKPGSST